MILFPILCRLLVLIGFTTSLGELALLLFPIFQIKSIPSLGSNSRVPNNYSKKIQFRQFMQSLFGSHIQGHKNNPDLNILISS